MKLALIADYVVLGGGNVHRFDQLPEGIERGKNENAFLGGLRLWETDERTGESKWSSFYPVTIRRFLISLSPRRRSCAVGWERSA